MNVRVVEVKQGLHPAIMRGITVIFMIPTGSSRLVLKVYNTYNLHCNQKKPSFLKLHPCDQDCSVWDHWDPCVAECDETQCSPEQETKLKKMVEDSLASIRTTIGDAKKVVEGVVLRIENMLFAKQNK